MQRGVATGELLPGAQWGWAIEQGFWTTDDAIGDFLWKKIVYLNHLDGIFLMGIFFLFFLMGIFFKKPSFWIFLVFVCFFLMGICLKAHGYGSRVIGSYDGCYGASPSEAWLHAWCAWGGLRCFCTLVMGLKRGFQYGAFRKIGASQNWLGCFFLLWNIPSSKMDDRCGVPLWLRNHMWNQNHWWYHQWLILNLGEEHSKTKCTGEPWSRRFPTHSLSTWGAYPKCARSFEKHPILTGPGIRLGYNNSICDFFCICFFIYLSIN